MSSSVKKVAFLKPEVVARDIFVVRFDKDGKVLATEKLDKDDGKKIAIDKDVNASDGHQIGFFKKYFGGVGAYMPFGSSKEQ